MQRTWMVVLAIVFIVPSVFAAEAVPLKTKIDKINYSIGVSTIRNFKQYGTSGDIKLDMIIKGMQDELAGTPLLMSEKELRAALMMVQTEIMQRKKTARALATMPGASVQTGAGNTNDKGK
jgi:hypothetical protein